MKGFSFASGVVMSLMIGALVLCFGGSVVTPTPAPAESDAFFPAHIAFAGIQLSAHDLADVNAAHVESQKMIMCNSHATPAMRMSAANEIDRLGVFSGLPMPHLFVDCSKFQF